MRRKSIGAGAIDQFRRGIVSYLLDEGSQSHLEGIDEVSVPSEHGIGIDLLDWVSGGVEGRFAPHVLEHEPSLDAGDFAAFHGMAALNVVAGGKMPDCAGRELDVHRHRGPNLASRGLGYESLDCGDVAGKVPHHVNRMGIERLDHVVRRAFVGIFDPHRHVDEELLSDQAVVNPFLCDLCGFCESMVEVNAQAAIVFFRCFDHFLCFWDRIADWFFAEDVATCLERLDRWEVMVRAVFDSARRDRDNSRLDRLEHGRRIVESRYSESL